MVETRFGARSGKLAAWPFRNGGTKDLPTRQNVTTTSTLSLPTTPIICISIPRAVFTNPPPIMEPRARAGKNVGKMNFSHNERACVLPPSATV